MPTSNPPTKRILILGILLTITISLPVAAAVSVPIIGSWEWGLTWGTALFVLMLGFLLALVPGAKALVGKFPILGKVFLGFGILGFVATAAIASYANPGGLLNGGSATATLSAGVGTSTATASAPSATGVVAWSAALYETTSDVTLKFANYYTFGTSIAPAVKIFPSTQSVTEKAAFEGTARPVTSGTASSGKLLLEGMQVQTIGCSIDVYTDLSGYYQHIERNVFVCKEKNDNGVNDVTPPDIYIKPSGTLSLDLSADTLTCSAGSQCTYSVRARNSAADTTIRHVAIKFENIAATGATGVNATLDAVDSGSAAKCSLVEVSGTQYLVMADEFESLLTYTCVVKITRLTGSADGEFKLTANDLFQDYGATGWNANSNIRGASSAADATADGKVDFA